MDLKLSGKRALVTGASAGIGRAIVKALAAEGVHVLAVARRADLLEDLRAEVEREEGVGPFPVVQDLRAAEAPQRLSQVVQEHGGIDILVNCAGFTQPVALDAADEVWMDAALVNYHVPRRITHALVPDLIRRGWGRVINITGNSEPEGLNATLPAKAAMHSWAKALSRELGPHNITVNCIPPGRILSEQMHRHHTDEEIERFARANIPLKRFGQPSELAALAVFLASPLSGYISGAVIPVDGGLRRYQH